MGEEKRRGKAIDGVMRSDIEESKEDDRGRNASVRERSRRINEGMEDGERDALTVRDGKWIWIKKKIHRKNGQEGKLI